ncbi:Ribosomal protein S6--L-glutamate ligase [Mucisphaera calidilacus]|uniref:Ribosomal protein S6--L-glutamate ligase n=2 Tax=Mucisphaera calidilacus TaxID=2527982 RepID=A0A518BZR8_9BACT|nr:alpha-L-glutamate ligase-like protein [Mucisphaera calidilacus]QDU72468.1 Ribosomal protein S6--L-glutamate ligase [Mucisphaera calidilacus]
MLRLVSPRALRERGIIGMNARNHRYIQRYNDRVNYPAVDNKLKTKFLATKAGVPVPDLLGVVKHQYQVKDLPKILDPLERFVIKPTRGCAGRGILVVVGRDEQGRFLKPSGAALTHKDVNRHVSNILAGLHSLGGVPDFAMIERIIDFTDAFEGYSYQGVPDVRVIVFGGYPILAMTRLSTARSDGKANLHQGAVGVGLSIRDGTALRAVQFNRPITAHPDTDKPFDQLRIPRWRDHLEIATRCYAFTHLGYFGADVVIDKHLGPLILELNARPGLAIQTANGIGLRKRLDVIEALDHDELPPVKDRVDFAQERFA